MLIAEIGNNHFGNLGLAKQLVRVARESGATHVKSQAFNAADLNGSMQPEFYKQCQFSLDEHVELIEYGRELGIQVFYSIFSDEYFELLNLYPNNIYKVSASQYIDYSVNPNLIKAIDKENTLISINAKAKIFQDIDHAGLMYASDYMVDDPRLSILDAIALRYGKCIGYSDHTLGLKWCKEAIDLYGCRTIEKHFTISKNKTFEGRVFRDTVHASDPKEFEDLAKLLTEGE